MTANTGRVHNAQASLPWTEKELIVAHELAAMDIVPVRLIRELLPNRNLSAAKTKIYSIRCGRNTAMSDIRIDGMAALPPDDPGIEDRDKPSFDAMVKLGSQRLLAAIERAGLVPA